MTEFDTTKYGTLQADVTYATVDGMELKMDVYYPSTGGPWPGVIFIHGGGWSEGDKAPLAVNPAQAGFLTVSINYRMYPAYRFPAMIEDVKCAIRYLRQHAGLFNLDSSRIGLIGHSAGAHLAALAGLVDDRLGWDVGPYLDQSSRVQAVVEVAGPTDLCRSFSEEVNAMKRNVFEEAHWASASPLTYANAGAPPFLIVHGDADEAVPVEQAELFYQALHQAGAPVEKIILHNGSHGLMPVGGEMTPSAETTFAMILAFLSRSLGRA